MESSQGPLSDGIRSFVPLAAFNWRLNSELITGLIFGGVLIVAPRFAQADCTCPSIPEAMDALRKADTAFIGTVQKVRKSPIKAEHYDVSFSIIRRLKGFQEIPGDGVSVYTPISTDECGYPFGDGQDYVVYAVGNPASLRTTTCNGTNFLDSVPEADRDKIISLAPER